MRAFVWPRWSVQRDWCRLVLATENCVQLYTPAVYHGILQTLVHMLSVNDCLISIRLVTDRSKALESSGAGLGP